MERQTSELRDMLRILSQLASDIVPGEPAQRNFFSWVIKYQISSSKFL